MQYRDYCRPGFMLLLSESFRHFTASDWCFSGFHFAFRLMRIMKMPGLRLLRRHARPLMHVSFGTGHLFYVLLCWWCRRWGAAALRILRYFQGVIDFIYIDGFHFWSINDFGYDIVFWYSFAAWLLKMLYFALAERVYAPLLFFKMPSHLGLASCRRSFVPQKKMYAWGRRRQVMLFSRHCHTRSPFISAVSSYLSRMVPYCTSFPLTCPPHL